VEISLRQVTANRCASNSDSLQENSGITTIFKKCDATESPKCYWFLVARQPPYPLINQHGFCRLRLGVLQHCLQLAFVVINSFFGSGFFCTCSLMETFEVYTEHILNNLINIIQQLNVLFVTNSNFYLQNVRSEEPSTI
jgi:hypothetical protein